jgi:hypothetical protein
VVLPIRAEEYCRTEANKVMVAGMDKGRVFGIIGCKSGGRTSLNNISSVVNF